MKRIIIYIYLLFFMTGCSEVINVDINSVEKSIVIYGFVASETKTQTLEVSSSVAYSDTSTNSVITDAEVDVNGYTYTYNSDEGVYLSDQEFGAELGTVYTLTVKCDFDSDGEVDEFVAETYLAEACCLTSASVALTDTYGYSYYLPYVNSGGRDEEQYWYAYFEVEGYDLYDDLADVTIMEASMIVGTQPSEDIPFMSSSFRSMFFSDEDEEKISKMFDEDSASQPVFVGTGDKITMTVATMEQDFYDFLSVLKQSNGSSNPVFGSGAVFLPCNISGNAIGYFGSLNQTDLEIIVP